MIQEEDALLLEAVEPPYHPRIERSKDEYFMKKKEEEQRNVQDKASKYYENEWVWAKEKELRELQEREENTRDDDIKRAIHYMIGVTVEALKLNFKRDALPGLLRLVIIERRKRAMERKWISREQAERVTSVWAPMPYPFDGQESDDQGPRSSRSPKELFKLSLVDLRKCVGDRIYLRVVVIWLNSFTGFKDGAVEVHSFGYYTVEFVSCDSVRVDADG